MKTFKKLSALILALMMTFTLFACDSKETETDNDSEKTVNSISTNSPECAVKAYFKAIEKADVDAYINLMPESRKIYYDSEDTSIEEDVEEMLKADLDELEDEYGKNVKFVVEVTSVDDFSTKMLKTIKESYHENADLDDIEIEEGKEVDFELTVKGDDDEDNGDGTAYVIKEDGEWKVWNFELDI